MTIKPLTRDKLYSQVVNQISILQNMASDLNTTVEIYHNQQGIVNGLLLSLGLSQDEISGMFIELFDTTDIVETLNCYLEC